MINIYYNGKKEERFTCSMIPVFNKSVSVSGEFKILKIFKKMVIRYGI